MSRGFIGFSVLIVSLFGLTSCLSDKTPVDHRPDAWQVRAPQIELPENPGHPFEVTLAEVKTVASDAVFRFSSLASDLVESRPFELRIDVSCQQAGQAQKASFRLQNQARVAVASLLPDDVLRNLQVDTALNCEFQFVATNALGSFENSRLY